MTTNRSTVIDADLSARVEALFRSQGLAVLSTQGEGQPYSSLVACAATPGLRQLLFATTRETRKFRNLATEPRVSLLVDNRANREADFQDAMAATAVGRAAEVEGADLAALRGVYLAKHPYLEDFLVAPTCALIRVQVETYHVVQRFQEVQELHPGA
ncbi:MAG: pyridoxamine 5'-phosphate oxidase family protein [Deferrisomatales bacterium]|nr:pyridoxamine 5'-phosphate oxidase family protein [Deferrisomatales bacterium]